VGTRRGVRSVSRSVSGSELVMQGPAGRGRMVGYERLTEVR
jgi:hypothetical protein